MEFTDKATNGYILTVTLTSLTADDDEKPDELEAKVTVVGITVGGTATGFNAKGSSKVKGINPKKLEEEAKFIVDDALGKLMVKQVIPAMLMFSLARMVPTAPTMPGLSLLLMNSICPSGIAST